VALVAGRHDLLHWLKGEMLHTMFITSPEDIAWARGVDDPSEWNWQFVRDLLADRDEAEEALRKRGEREKRVGELRRSRKTLMDERERIEPHRASIAANDRIPKEKQSKLLGELDQRLSEIEHELQAIGDEFSRLKGAQTEPLSKAEHLVAHLGGKPGQNQRIEAMANRIGDRYSLDGDDAFLLALARKNPSASRLLRVWETTEEFLEDQAEGLREKLGQRQRIVFTLDRRVEPGIYTADVPVLGRTEIFVRHRGRQAQTIAHVRSEQIEAVQKQAVGARLRLMDGEQGRSLDEPLTYTVTEVETETYHPYQVITVSPNLLLAMVPGDAAPEAASAVLAFLEDERKVDAIHENAREEAERRAEEWGFDDAL